MERSSYQSHRNARLDSLTRTTEPNVTPMERSAPPSEIWTRPADSPPGAAKIPQVAPWVDQAEAASVAECFAANWLTEGPKADAFSDRLNALMGAPYGVFAPNGTMALVLGLLAVGVGPGDEVLVPDTTFAGSGSAVVMTGATPVFVEVNKDNFQIDVADAERRLTRMTRAIMPVHLFGMICDMDAVMAFARQYGLKVVEDAAQAVGVRYRGRHAGVFGDVGCFSFFADKTITTGEGGYVVTADQELYERLRLLRNQGRLDRGSFIHPALGFNFRITDMQAAVGLMQLEKLDTIIARKREILGQYMAALDGVGAVRFLTLQEGSGYVPFRVVLMAERAHDLMAFLNDSGVQTRSFFYPMHRQPCFAHLAADAPGRDAGFANADYGYDHGVCLPVFPTLSDQQVAYICDRVRAFYRG